MTEQIHALKLDFQLETDDDKADLDHSAAVVQDTVSALPGVDEADAHATGPSRLADPVTIGAVLLTVRYAVKNSADIVTELDELVKELKNLARDLGLPRLWIWLRRKKVDVNDLTAEQLKELLPGAGPAKN